MEEKAIRVEIGSCILSLGFLLVNDLKIRNEHVFSSDEEYVENTIRCCQYNLENILSLTKQIKNK
jgi:hypothetical protein